MRESKPAAPPTLIDVAREAGVSPMTVSRVVRGTGLVGEDTRLRVERAIATVGYVPNSAARGLRGTRTGTIGLIVPDMTNPFYTTLAHGVETAARKAGVTMILANSDEHDAEEQRLARMLIGKQVDGLLVTPARTGAEVMRLSRQRGVDLVFVARQPKDAGRCDVVRADAEGGGYALGQHLVSLGHVHTAVLAGPAAAVTGPADRVDGFRRALVNAGNPAPDLYRRPVYTVEAGAAMAAEAMRACPPPTALFAASNFMAMGALQALEAMGLHVPDDVSIVGFDDFPAAWLAFPFMTAVQQPAFELGYEAFGMLLDRQTNPDRPPRELILGTELLIRRSTAPPRVLERAVATSTADR